MTRLKYALDLWGWVFFRNFRWYRKMRGGLWIKDSTPGANWVDMKQYQHLFSDKSDLLKEDYR